MTPTDLGHGATWLDFLGTHRGRYRASGAELLADLDDLHAFLAEHGLDPGSGGTPADLQRAHAVREALHRTTVAVTAGRSAAPADVALLSDALAHDRPLRPEPVADGVRVAAPADLDQALARIAREALGDLTGPRLALLRPCGDQTCSGYFLDFTGRRRWCSDTRCGSRARVRAHRARRAGTAEYDR